MSSIWLSSCTRRGSILHGAFLLQIGAAAAVTGQRRRAEPRDPVAPLIEPDGGESRRGRSRASDQPIPVRAGHEQNMSFPDLLDLQLRRGLHHRLLGGRSRRRRLVEQRHDAVDQLTQPLERGKQNGRRMPPPAPEPHSTRLRLAVAPPCRRGHCWSPAARAASTSFAGATSAYASSAIPAISSQSSPRSRRTPSQPRWPT